ncbi:hypothetical protein DB30_03439 [Enhygromyxa salina]|uniref:Uncharacterized protein n=1 Tax=Enhygromyxa salina TaxID=215803 RepID=A0A0C2CUF0_9BACT|nr:hypothetical protein DB30_03439 [Enhygromyxa salina]
MNGESLDGLADVIDAYFEVENDSTFVLGFSRSSTTYYYTYYISYSK